MIELQIVVLYLLKRTTETTTKIIKNGLFFEITSIISTLSVADSAVLLILIRIEHVCHLYKVHNAFSADPVLQRRK